MHKCTEAIQDFSAVLALDPDFASAAYARGSQNFRLQAVDNSIS
jgi:hypothetical protein